MSLRIKDTATPALSMAIRRLERPRPVMEAAGKAVEVRLQRHFKERQAEGNKHGWPSQNFWHGGPNSVSSNTGLESVTETRATVAVADVRFMFKVEGGTIRPKRAKLLRIPLRAEAYALGNKGSVRESAPFLKFIKTKSGFYLVRERDSVTEFWFRLVPKVTQEADPRALPPAGEFEAAIERAVDTVLPLLLKTEGQS